MLRPAVPGDVPELVRLANLAYQRYVARIGVLPAPMRADYAAEVAGGRVWVWAPVPGAVQGLIVLVPRPDHLLLENLAVLPRSHGHGIGTRLMNFAEEYARAQGLPEVRLYTNESMTENLRYYPRRGYVETHRAEENGFRRVYFRKSVAP
jgi:GNAT superfamily N-acetyltransferase